MIPSTGPLVTLHDHLDGGVRPATLCALARQLPSLPTLDAARLATVLAAARGDLVRYLEAFAVTLPALQTPEALARVACEAVEDLAAAGVRYAELRLAPALHTRAGLTLDEVLAAVTAAGAAAAEATGTTVRWISCIMRQDGDGDAVVEASIAARTRGLGVVGVDLAGPERGFPARAHASALARARDAGLGVTIHAGEAAGIESIADALACGATRIGHGVALAAALDTEAGATLAAALATTGTVLELCPSSNLHTGVAPTLAALGLDRLWAAGVPLTVHPDNRTVSATSAPAELARLTETLGWGPDRHAVLQAHAIRAAFVDAATRDRLEAELAAGWHAAGVAWPTC